MRVFATCRCVAVASLLCLSVGASALTITYTATDLADLTAGEDLWRYDYAVDGAFAAFEGFRVVFAPGAYSVLQSPQPSASADWSTFVVEPDTSLPADGEFNAQAPQAASAIGVPFSVEFAWHGAGAPIAQPFDLFDGNFDVLSSGSTSAVPLPTPSVLLLGALLPLMRRRRR